MSRYIYRVDFNCLKYNSDLHYSVKIGNFPKKKFSFKTAYKNQSLTECINLWGYGRK